MVELKRWFLIFVTTPFMVVGVAWQIIAGGFVAGRIVANRWTSQLATDVLVKRFGPELVAALSEKRGGKDLH